VDIDEEIFLLTIVNFNY